MINIKYDPYDRLLKAAIAQPIPSTGNDGLDKYLQKCKNNRIIHYQGYIDRINTRSKIKNTNNK
jgi:hypothetical protein